MAWHLRNWHTTCKHWDSPCCWYHDAQYKLSHEDRWGSVSLGKTILILLGLQTEAETSKLNLKNFCLVLHEVCFADGAKATLFSVHGLKSDAAICRWKRYMGSLSCERCSALPSLYTVKHRTRWISHVQTETLFCQVIYRRATSKDKTKEVTV